MYVALNDLEWNGKMWERDTFTNNNVHNSGELCVMVYPQVDYILVYDLTLAKGYNENFFNYVRLILTKAPVTTL